MISVDDLMPPPVVRKTAVFQVAQLGRGSADRWRCVGGHGDASRGGNKPSPANRPQDRVLPEPQSLRPAAHHTIYTDIRKFSFLSTLRRMRTAKRTIASVRPGRISLSALGRLATAAASLP